MTVYRVGSKSKIEGDNVELVSVGDTLTDIDEPKTKTYTCACSQYFSKIKITLTNGQNTYGKRLYNFEITCGTIRVKK